MTKPQWILSGLLVVSAVAACKPTDSTTTVPVLPEAANIYRSSQGVNFEVDLIGKFAADALPQNADLKMADGDLAKYAQQLCNLENKPKYAPVRCDVYVQPDSAGSLIGYAAVSEMKDGVTLSTTTSLNSKKQPRGATTCAIEGSVLDAKGDYAHAVKTSSTDFEGRIEYSATAKGDGDFLVSPVDPSATDDSEGTMGVWYVTKQGDKLRLAQERWNYCYTDSGVQIDEVFKHAVSITRQPN